jgi:threonyl-tRNA synthetase
MTTENQRFEPGTVGAALAAAGSLRKDTVAARAAGRLLDLMTALPEGEAPTPVSAQDADALHVIRHSAAHVMADAVQRLFPGTKVTIGPSIENGFYYDFDRPAGMFTDEDLPAIEEEMKRIIAGDLPFRREVVTHERAREVFSALGETYKLEILDGIPEGEPVSLYRHGEWVDLCAGPHLPSTRHVRAVKLLSTAGAYWRGDERNKMLSRLYGTAFFDRKDLAAHLAALEEAKKRDHRKLGKELDLFSIDDAIGGGLVLWHPRGARVRVLIEDHWRRAHLASGYDLLFTPHIGRAHLWETSGHLENYAESMYAPMEIEGNPYYIKPMNCPFHIAVYRSKMRSYRDLPLRWAELGTVYRYERSGQLHGLLRVRGFTQDDAHLFMRDDQLPGEVRRLIRFTHRLLRDFGFESFEMRLSTRPEKHIGSPEIWDRAEAALKEGLAAEGVAYELDPGEGTFYGPKIDVKIRDAIGRLWQCSTTQVDFNLPERFDLSYIGEDSKRHRPVMLHRTILGSMERFFGVLVEHHAGAFPMWLAPEQVALLTVTDAHRAFAREVAAALDGRGVRVALDLDNEKLGAKIRGARLQRIPALAVIGDQEVERRGVSLRTRADGEIGFKPLGEFIDWAAAAGREPAVRFEDRES